MILKLTTDDNKRYRIDLLLFIVDRQYVMVLSRQERENLVLDLYYNQNKNYRQIAKEAKICPRDIKTIVDRASNEKDRQEHRSLSTQAYARNQ